MSPSETNVRIGILLASVRESRRGEGFAKWIRDLVSARTHVEVSWLDLREFARAAEPPPAF